MERGRPLKELRAAVENFQTCQFQLVHSGLWTQHFDFPCPLREEQMFCLSAPHVKLLPLCARPFKVSQWLIVAKTSEQRKSTLSPTVVLVLQFGVVRTFVRVTNVSVCTCSSRRPAKSATLIKPHALKKQWARREETAHKHSHTTDGES